MRRIFLLLFVLFWMVGQVEAAQYCLRNDGTAGSKTAATDCLTVGDCMNETVHNGETFADNDVILVCPHGGAFDIQITSPSSGTSGNEIIYESVYSSQYGWPIFDEGFALATNYVILNGLEIRPGAAESGTKTFEGGRFADATRSWEAAEETAVDDWATPDAGIFAVGLGATGGALSGLTPQLYWRDKTDAGSFAAVGATGEVKYTAVSGLTDNNDVTSGEAGVSSGKTYATCNQCEQEDSHQASTTTDLSADYWAELQVGVSFADADDGHEYEFSLHESDTQVGTASAATVTVCKPASTNSTVKLFWRAEGTDLSGGVDDYSAGDTSAASVDGATLTSTRVKMGSNSIDAESGGCSATDGGAYEFTTSLDNIFDGAQGRFGFWWNKDCNGNETVVFVALETTNSYYVQVKQYNQGLRFIHNDSGGQDIADTTGTLSDDTWYWLEIKVDASGNVAGVYVYDANLDAVDSAVLASGIEDITPSGGLDYLRFGDPVGGANRQGDQFLDHIVVSTAHGVFLKPYANDPTYSTCVAE